jgi:neutral ceramidase
VPEHLAAVVEAATTAILAAWRGAAPTGLGIIGGAFDPAVPVAWNRSLRAYNRNPEVQRRTLAETHLALDRGMQLLSLRRDGQLQAFISLFGVHATCLSAHLRNYDGDNKGYAAAQAEAALQQAGAVAIFAQATAGDVSPHFHGPRQLARRKALRGEAEYEYAQRNGRHQSELALALLASGAEQPLSGGIDAVLSYADLSAVHADAQFAGGETEAYTSEPCHGVAFFAGTPVDGPGIAAPLAALIKRAALTLQRLRLRRLPRYSAEDQAYYRRLYAAQSPKAIFLEAGRKSFLGQTPDRLKAPDFLDPTVGELKRQARAGAVKHSAMIPSVLPLQIVRSGGLALVCCPGEFTTTAGARLRSTVEQRLAAHGVTRVLICTYSNDYMGYVTTAQEYDEQAYEGGHTVYGKWTLAAFQTLYARLAEQLAKPAAQRTHDRTTRPAPVPAEELALRTNSA